MTLSVLEYLNSPERLLSRTAFAPIDRRRTQWVVEVLGPAGAGKTTLIRSLRDRVAARDKFRELPGSLQISWPNKLWAFRGLARRLVPMYLLERTGSCWFSREDLRRLVRVMTLYHVLTQPSADGTIAMIDHGPICMLGMVQAFGPEFVETQHFTRWKDAAIALWRRTLDVVVWLDAPDATLVERINGRENDHEVKGKLLEEASIFLQRCRLSYEQILSELTCPSDPQVLRFDTSKVSTNHIAAQLLNLLKTRPAFNDIDAKVTDEQLVHVAQ